MSKHMFRTTHENEPIIVFLGWDRPLQGYFMFIERPNRDDEEEKYLYSNLDETESHPKTLDVFLTVLDCFRISLPQQMIDEVVIDGCENCGNKTVEHKVIGGHYQRKSLYQT